MRCRFLVTVILTLTMCAAAVAQATPPASKPVGLPGMGAPQKPAELAPAPAAASVPDSAPVITIEGICESGSGADCKTVVTKAEFERLTSALDPNMTAQQKASFADQYAKVVAMGVSGERTGVDKDARGQEVMKFMRMQVIAQLMNQKLQESAKDVPAAEVQKYYDDHKSDFDEVTIRRIFIPRHVPGEAKQMSDADFTTLANEIGKRAKAGEDFNALQKEAFDKMGIKNPPPPTDMGAARKNAFPPSQATIIFELKPNETSSVIEEPTGAMIYKVLTKRTLSLDEAKADIQRMVQVQRYQQAMSGLFDKAKASLNPQYFGPNATATLPGQNPPQAPPMGARPPGQ